MLTKITRPCRRRSLIFGISPHPPAELKSFLEKNSDFDSLSANDLSHVPYIVIIYKYLKQWQAENERSATSLPSNSKEKRQLKSLIEDQRDHYREKLTGDGKHIIELENFDEALKAVNQVLVPSDYVPEETQAVLKELDQALNDSDGLNRQFWLLVKGLKQFMQNNGNRLPLKGRIPDMTSDSTRYIELQNIYKQKSREDSEAVSAIIENFENEDRERFVEISDSFLRTFCANSHCLRLIRAGRLNSQLDSEQVKEKINSLCLDNDRLHQFGHTQM